MLILAIDTTGFSASIALVKDGREVLLNKISSGYIPNKYWKDFPYILPAYHQKFLIKNIKKIDWKKIDAIAVSANSGIYTCILVGLAMAKVLAHCYQKPLIEVDHILAHLYSTWLEREPEKFNFPILVFSASGSHSDFSLLKNMKTCQTIFDTVPKQAKGEVKFFIGIGKIFYQVGKKLGVIPSTEAGVGKLIKASSQGNPNRFDFTKFYKGHLLNLNFFDFMESIDDFVKKEKRKTKSSNQFIKDVAASFQESITRILIDKIIKLAQMKKAQEIHIAGGISENKYLENKLKQKIKKEKLDFILRYPTKKDYRLDNAAMIGALAYYQEKYKIKFKGFEANITK